MNEKTNPYLEPMNINTYLPSSTFINIYQPHQPSSTFINPFALTTVFLVKPKNIFHICFCSKAIIC